MNIYVGNLSPDTSEDKLRKLFEQYGKAASINIIKDKFSGCPPGFGFVKMLASKEAQQAISALNRRKINRGWLWSAKLKLRPNAGVPSENNKLMQDNVAHLNY